MLTRHGSGSHAREKPFNLAPHLVKEEKYTSQPSSNVQKLHVSEISNRRWPKRRVPERCFTVRKPSE